MKQAAVLGLSSYLPDHVVSNADLVRDFPDWSVERIAGKTGIDQRHITKEGEYASDLAVCAAQRLFAQGFSPEEIDYVVLCTQSPDYLLPTTACLLQDRLGIPQTAGALDFNLGCSGYVYGLGLVQGLIATGQASRVLLLTADTYSKFLDPQDRGAITIFGDGASATLIGSVPHDGELASAPYVYGTDGSGAKHLIYKGSGLRPAGGECQCSFLHMNGPEVFTFAIKTVPGCVSRLLEKAGKSMEDVDLFVFHQANRYMLDHLRRKLNIPEDKFVIAFADCGNTVSSTIPLALESAMESGQLKAGQLVMLVGFGVGLSWGATLLSWPLLGLEKAG